jgi:hypothetical protein
MIRGADDDDPRGGFPLQQIVGDTKRDARLAGARRCHGKKIRLGMVRDPLESPLLPVAQLDLPWFQQERHDTVLTT